MCNMYVDGAKHARTRRIDMVWEIFQLENGRRCRLKSCVAASPLRPPPSSVAACRSLSAAAASFPHRTAYTAMRVFCCAMCLCVRPRYNYTCGPGFICAHISDINELFGVPFSDEQLAGLLAMGGTTSYCVRRVDVTGGVSDQNLPPNATSYPVRPEMEAAFYEDLPAFNYTRVVFFLVCRGGRNRLALVL